MNFEGVDWFKFPNTFAFIHGWRDARASKPCLFRKGWIVLTDLDQEFYMEGYHAGMWFDTPNEEYC